MPDRLHLACRTTTDPAKTTLYAQDGLTIGNSFPGGVLPANLLDPNAVLFMKTGAIPASNSTGANGAPQYVASPRQPTFVREDVVRVDHDITYRAAPDGALDSRSDVADVLPGMWSNDTYPTTGDVFGIRSWGSVIKLT